MESRDKRDDDAEIFSDAMKEVTPLKPHNLAVINKNPVPIPPRRVPDSVENEDYEESAFVRSGIQRIVLRKLRNGQIPIEDELDLHGDTVQEAEYHLRTFLLRTQTPGKQRAVRVIHGKGLGSPNRKSVLKDKVNSWLRESEAVLAFCLAGSANGGSGAVHVLLKRASPRK